MPPPPGLNEIHVRSLEYLQLKFLKLRIDSPDMGPDHVPLPLHWWLLVGMGFIALVMTGNLARRRCIMQTADTTFGRPARHLRLDLRAEDIVSTRLAAKNVSEAIASGNDQGKSIDSGLRRVPRHWARARLRYRRLQVEKWPHEFGFLEPKASPDLAYELDWERGIEGRLVGCYESKLPRINELTHISKKSRPDQISRDYARVSAEAGLYSKPNVRSNYSPRRSLTSFTSVHC